MAGRLRSLSTSEPMAGRPRSLSTSVKGELLFFGDSLINRLIIDIKDCVRDLKGFASYANIEKWACMIYESMSCPSRSYHSLQHVFDIIHEDADSIQKLATHFHDVVYYNIDGGLSEEQQALIGEFISEEDDVISIAKISSDENLIMTMEIFGFDFGTVLDPFNGLNEFLSAALAVRCYQVPFSHTPAILAQIAACIEATIPFRKCDENGKWPCDHLFDRMTLVNTKYDLGMTEEELVKCVQRSVDLGNSDVGNFATTDHSNFLANTWDLLPESNISLRNTIVFRISDFALALKKMADFIEFLDPECLYMSFRDPEHAILMAEKIEAARTNLDVVLKYMHCKRLSIAVVAAIAELTGGDAPITLFLGEHYIATAIEEFVEKGPDPDLVLNQTVLGLLTERSEANANFDIHNSPLAAYIYAIVGSDGIDQCMKYAVHPMDKENAMGLLQTLPYDCVVNIVELCAENCITRRTAIDDMMIEITN